MPYGLRIKCSIEVAGDEKCLQKIKDRSCPAMVCGSDFSSNHRCEKVVATMKKVMEKKNK